MTRSPEILEAKTENRTEAFESVAHGLVTIAEKLKAREKTRLNMLFGSETVERLSKAAELILTGESDKINEATQIYFEEINLYSNDAGRGRNEDPDSLNELSKAFKDLAELTETAVGWESALRDVQVSAGLVSNVLETKANSLTTFK